MHINSFQYLIQIIIKKNNLVHQERSFILQLTIKVCFIFPGEGHWEFTKPCQDTRAKWKATLGSGMMDSRPF